MIFASEYIIQEDGWNKPLSKEDQEKLEAAGNSIGAFLTTLGNAAAAGVNAIENGVSIIVNGVETDAAVTAENDQQQYENGYNITDSDTSDNVSTGDGASAGDVNNNTSSGAETEESGQSSNMTKPEIGASVVINTTTTLADIPYIQIAKSSKNVMGKAASKVGPVAAAAEGYQMYTDYNLYSGTDLAKAWAIDIGTTAGGIAITGGVNIFLGTYTAGTATVVIGVPAAIVIGVQADKANKYLKTEYTKTDEQKKGREK